jgi:hypothetical protein
LDRNCEVREDLIREDLYLFSRIVTGAKDGPAKHQESYPFLMFWSDAMGGVFGPPPIAWSEGKKAHGRAFLPRKHGEMLVELSGRNPGVLDMLNGYEDLI